MILCLSSGSRPRYREDILAGMALPSGASVRLRYRHRWVAADILKAVAENQVVDATTGGWRVLYGYIDQSRQHERPDIIPLRYGRILTAEDLGTALSFTVEMLDIVGDLEVADFNERLGRATADLPRWTTEDGRVTVRGRYCLRYPLCLHPPGGAGPPAAGAGLAAWEARIRDLDKRREFSSRRVYCVVEGVRGGWLNSPARIADGVLRLRPGRGYDVRVYHFDPSDRESMSPHPTFDVQSSSDEVRIVTPPLVMDSAYDVKTVRLRTGRPAVRDEGVLVVSASHVEAPQVAKGTSRTERFRTFSPPEPASAPQRAFELPVRVGGWLGGKLAAAGMIGIALAAQALLVLRNEFEVVGSFVEQNGPAGVLAVVILSRLRYVSRHSFGRSCAPTPCLY